MSDAIADRLAPPSEVPSLSGAAPDERTGRTGPLPIALLGLLILGACALAVPARAAAAPAPAGAGPAPPGFKLGGDAAKGRQVYLTYCATCHGEDGRGRGEGAALLTVKPQDLTDPHAMAHRSDWELYRVVRDGGPAAGLSPAMMGWKVVLPEADIRNVTAFVRTLARASAHPAGGFAKGHPG